MVFSEERKLFYGRKEQDMAENERVLDPEYVALAKKFSYGLHTEPEGCQCRYRLFTPALEAGKRYPLVIFLHGSGERGEDNELQVAGNRGAVVWVREEEQAQRPCYVLAPQAPPEGTFALPSFERAFFDFLRKFTAQNPVDTNRIYLTGLSMGGMGTWRYLARYPEIFAAGGPICGAGDPTTLPDIRHIPVWAFHAADDPIVPVEAKGLIRQGAAMYGTRLLVSALRACGGDVRYTEYPPGYIHEHFGYPEAFAGHAAWEPAYENEEFRRWLFAQDRSARDRFTLIRPGVWALDDYSGASYYLLEGRDRALAIDTGMGRGPILPLLQTLTDKPIDLAVTHAHGDHMRHAGEFGRVYISAREKALPGDAVSPEALCFLEDGDIIDLGGGITVEAAACYGHTPGSMVFADHGHRCLFCGDAFGSGIFVLMSVPGALPLSAYKSNLEALDVKLARWEDYAWFGGHRGQAQGSFEDSPFLPYGEKPTTFNPLRRQIVLDMIALCEKILRGEAEAKPASFGAPDPDDPSYLADFANAAILYRQSQVC